MNNTSKVGLMAKGTISFQKQTLKKEIELVKKKLLIIENSEKFIEALLLFIAQYKGDLDKNTQYHLNIHEIMGLAHLDLTPEDRLLIFEACENILSAANCEFTGHTIEMTTEFL